MTTNADIGEVPGSECGITKSVATTGTSFPLTWSNTASSSPVAVHFTPVYSGTWVGVEAVITNDTGAPWGFGGTSMRVSGNVCSSSAMDFAARTELGTGLPSAATADSFYTLDYLAGDLVRFDRHSLSVLATNNSVFQFSQGVVIVGDEIWVGSNNNSNNLDYLRIFDRFTLDEVDAGIFNDVLPPRPSRLQYDSTSGTVYAMCANGTVAKINAATRAVVSTVSLGEVTQNMTLTTSGGAKLWVTAFGSNGTTTPDGKVYRINCSSMTVAGSTSISGVGVPPILQDPSNSSWVYVGLNTYTTSFTGSIVQSGTRIRRLNSSTGALDSLDVPVIDAPTTGFVVRDGIIYNGKSNGQIGRFNVATNTQISSIGQVDGGDFFTELVAFDIGPTFEIQAVVGSVSTPTMGRLVPTSGTLAYPPGTWSINGTVASEGVARGALLADGETLTLRFDLDAAITAGQGEWGLALDGGPAVAGGTGYPTVESVTFIAAEVPAAAAFTASPTTGPSVMFVEFDASESNGNGSAITSYEWDFGDGTTATGVTVNHTYDTPNAYVATLTITTSAGTAQATEVINVLGSEVTTSYTPSGYFYDALRWSHRAFARVVLRTPDCETLNLPIVSGNVTIDRGGKTFRSADLEIAIESLGTTNRTALEKITVQSGEVELYSGITFEDNSTEEILVGRMRIDSLEIGDGATARIGAFDYALMLDEHPVTPADGTKIPAGTDWRVAIRRLIEDTFTWKPCGMDTMFVVDPAVKAWAIPEQAWDNVNRLTAILEWAESRNCWFYNLPDGRFYLTPIVENGPSVWTVNSGDEGVLVKATQRFSREAQYNGVSISFDTPDGEYESIRGFIIDTEPGSTTRWGGPFGKRVLDLSGIPAANPAEAEAIAYRKLKENRGATKSLSLTTVRNPALVPGQVIRVIHPMIDDELHVIDRVTHQLGGATSDIDCKLSRQ